MTQTTLDHSFAPRVAGTPGRVLGAALLLVAAATSAADEPAFSQGWRFQQRSGEAIYRANCAACHMPDGRGAQGAASYPALAGNPRVASAAYVATMVRHGRRAMPGFAGELDEAQITAVAEQVRQRFAPGAPSTPSAEPAPARAVAAASAATPAVASPAASPAAAAAPVVRHRLPDSDFPIALAVEIPAGKTVVHLSGAVPPVADDKAERGSLAAYGDTRTQTVGTLRGIERTLKGLGLSMGDVVKMQVFLVGDPAKGGKMDFAGFMAGYREFFGTAAQPKLPARSVMQVAALVAPGWLVEIEVTAVRP